MSLVLLVGTVGAWTVDNPAFAQPLIGTGGVQLHGGQKLLDSSDWDPVDRQIEIGASVDAGAVGFPVRALLIGSTASATGNKAGANFTSRTSEVGAGFRIAPGSTGALMPFFDSGLAHISASISSASGSYSEQGLGFFGGAGAYYEVEPGARLGASLRLSSAKLKAGETSIDAGGIHLLISIGFGFSAQEYGDEDRPFTPSSYNPGSDPSDFFTASDAPVSKRMADDSYIYVGDSIVATHSNGTSFKGIVTRSTAEKFWLDIGEGRLVEIGWENLARFERTQAHEFATLPRPSGAGPVFIETMRAGLQEVAAGRAVKAVLINGDEVVGTVRGVSVDGIVMQDNEGTERLVWAKEIAQLIPW